MPSTVVVRLVVGVVRGVVSRLAVVLVDVVVVMAVAVVITAARATKQTVGVETVCAGCQTLR